MAKPELEPELIRIERAAKWLDIQPNTLHHWIMDGKFTEQDGLCRIGGVTRIHFPTLKARTRRNALLRPKPRRPKPAVFDFTDVAPTTSQLA
jgi:hypothetical protein